MQTFYVLNRDGLVEHEGNESSCKLWVQNVQALWGKSGFRIVQGAKELKKLQSK